MGTPLSHSYPHILYDPCIMDTYMHICCACIYTLTYGNSYIIVVQNELYKFMACMFNICYNLGVFQVFYN